MPQLPDLPTVAESGYPGFEGFGSAGIVVRSGTPAELVERISKDVQQVLSDLRVREDIVARGGIPDEGRARRRSGASSPDAEAGRSEQSFADGGLARDGNVAST